MPAPPDDLINFLPCGILSFDGNGRVTYINPFLLQKLSYSVEEIMGQPIDKIFTLATRIFYQTHFFPLLKLQGKVEEIFLNLKSKEGDDIPFLVNATHSTNDYAGCTFCIFMPVEQRRKYEDEILLAKKTAEDALYKNEELLKIKTELEKEREELDKRITQLQRKNTELLQLQDVVTHDLQEPVRKIGMFTDIVSLEVGENLNDRTLNALAVVRKSAARIQTLLVRLQEYMVISTEVIIKSSVDLNVIVREEMLHVQKENDIDGVVFDVERLPVLQGSELQMRLLFREILSNCLQFKSSDRKLSIKIRCSLIQNNQYNSIAGKYKFIDVAKISVEDNGMGFDTGYAKHIFKILKKTDTISGGLGFGLAFCETIVENHGGSISAIGNPGSGATFTITLPLENESMRHV